MRCHHWREASSNVAKPGTTRVFGRNYTTGAALGPGSKRRATTWQALGTMWQYGTSELVGCLSLWGHDLRWWTVASGGSTFLRHQLVNVGMQLEQREQPGSRSSSAWPALKGSRQQLLVERSEEHTSELQSPI